MQFTFRKQSKMIFSRIALTHLFPPIKTKIRKSKEKDPKFIRGNGLFNQFMFLIYAFYLQKTIPNDIFINSFCTFVSPKKPKICKSKEKDPKFIRGNGLFNQFMF